MSPNQMLGYEMLAYLHIITQVEPLFNLKALSVNLMNENVITQMFHAAHVTFSINQLVFSDPDTISHIFSLRTISIQFGVQKTTDDLFDRSEFFSFAVSMTAAVINVNVKCINCTCA